MLGVIINHALQSLYELHTANFTIAGTGRIALMNLCIVAVNCFVMISGFFRIKRSLRGFLNLYLQLLFYSLIAFAVNVIIDTDFSKINGLKRIVFPLTESGLWFIVPYLALFLLAPFLNTALDNMTRNERSISLFTLLFVDIYLGYMHQSEEITTGGYHLIHFIVLYCLGSWLNEHKDKLLPWRWGG